MFRKTTWSIKRVRPSRGGQRRTLYRQVSMAQISVEVDSDSALCIFTHKFYFMCFQHITSFKPHGGTNKW